MGTPRPERGIGVMGEAVVLGLDRLCGTYSAVPWAGYDAMQIGIEEIGDERAADFQWQLRSPALGTIGNSERGAPDNR